MDSKKITPISECFKVPKEVCGEKGCNLVPGPEVCYDETQTVIQQVVVDFNQKYSKNFSYTFDVYMHYIDFPFICFRDQLKHAPWILGGNVGL